jgi:predicted ATPase/DNA-binding SARP family transcriptional activator
VLFCRVLGPLEVEVDGTTVNLGGPTVRRTLAALLAADSEPLSDDALAEQVWGDNQPNDVPGALSVVVHRLRKTLGPKDRARLRRSVSGYMLTVPRELTDRGRFVSLIEDGLRQLADNASDLAAKTLSSALELWRGEPWADLGDTVSVHGARNRLIELREVAVEEFHAAQLARGDTAGAVASLSEAVTQAPYRERRWELLALGLYRSGQQGQALAELRRVRELLIDELGVEPGPALRKLEQRMLEHDPDLLPSAPSATAIDTEIAHPLITKPVTSLVGRAADLELLAHLLFAHRMVTLLGPAGVGKTRLAVEHAASAGADVCFVRLADVRAAEAVAAAVAEAIGLVNVDGDPAGLILRVLAERAGLLVLDNCEHVVDGVAQLVVPLLESCLGIRILTTSRRTLGVDGEHVMPVEPLAVRDADGADGSAVRLLLDRVRSNHAGWQQVSNDLNAAREICELLDGLPLAIELAAARERVFGLADIAAHLRARIDVLAPTPRGSISHHASLNAAIGWSIDHLDAPDRAFLLRLWPFEGGFTWRAAAAVQPASKADRAVLAVLASLVDRSVVVADSAARRYRLLETVRMYCRDADPDPAATEEAHAAWVRDMVARNVALMPGHRIGEAFRALAADLANIRAGIGYTLGRDPLAALRVAAPLEWAWSSIGALHEGMHLIRRALDACPDAPVEDRARGLNALAIMSFHVADSAATVRYSDAALDLLGDHPAGDRAALWFAAMVNRAGAAVDLFDVALARDSLDRIHSEGVGYDVPHWVTASAMVADGAACLLEGQQADGEAKLHAAGEFAERCGFAWAQGTAELVLARSLLRGRAPDPVRAREALRAARSAVRVFEDQDNVFDILGALYTGAEALAALSLTDAAVQIRAGVIEQARRVGANSQHFARLAGREVEQRMRPLEREHTAAAQAGRSMSRADIVTLFDDTLAGLNIPGP